MAKVKQLPTRQRIRKALVFVSFLLLPITLYYFSPYIIVDSASQGIINLSFIVFGLMFLSALFVGRLWCGWVCPAGGVQELCAPVNDKPVPGGKFNWIKWGIWIPWIGAIAVLAVQAGGYHTVNPFYQLEGGVTLTQPFWYMIYYIILVLFVGLSVVAGRRAGCHYLCWMAPFMIIGRKIRNLFKWPSLRLKAEVDNCIDCKKCSKTCLMSLDVNQMVREGTMENSECILCGSCVDVCPQGTLAYSFSRSK